MLNGTVCTQRNKTLSFVDMPNAGAACILQVMVGKVQPLPVKGEVE